MDLDLDPALASSMGFTSFGATKPPKSKKRKPNPPSSGSNSLAVNASRATPTSRTTAARATAAMEATLGVPIPSGLATWEKETGGESSEGVGEDVGGVEGNGKDDDGGVRVEGGAGGKEVAGDKQEGGIATVGGLQGNAAAEKKGNLAGLPMMLSSISNLHQNTTLPSLTRLHGGSPQVAQTGQEVVEGAAEKLGGGTVEGKSAGRPAGMKPDGQYDWHALRRGIRDENGDVAYFDWRFVEDPWRGMS